VISELGRDCLQATTLQSIRSILGDTDIARASIWADQMRSNPSPWWQEVAGAYHYVTVPAGLDYSAVGAPPRGDAVTALQEFAATLASPVSSRVDKQLALRFSIHIVQDLHQPLHVGNGTDRGGTRTWVRFNGRKENLHKVWDSSLISASGYTDAKWLEVLREGAAKLDCRRWQQVDPLLWIAESVQLRQQIYPATATLPKTYVTRFQPELERRLRQGGARTAAYLNAIFKPSEADSGS